MQVEIASYLEEVRARLHLGLRTEKRIVRELYTHFQEKTTDLERQGVPRSAAAQDAIQSLGDPKMVARLMYQAYSSSSWMDALIGAQPYLFAACLFATGLWQNPFALLLYFAAIAGVTFYGWLHGAPNWLYNWVAHCLLSLASAGYLFRTILTQTAALSLTANAPLAAFWPVALLLALFGATVWMAVPLLVRVLRLDWVFVSLMLMPFPVVGLWLVRIQPLLHLFRTPEMTLHAWDTLMASCCLLLATASGLFARLRQRFFKLAAVLIGAECVFAWVVYKLWEGVSFVQLLAAATVVFLFVLSPALLHLRLLSGSPKTTSWLEEWSDVPPEGR